VFERTGQVDMEMHLCSRDEYSNAAPAAIRHTPDIGH